MASSDTPEEGPGDGGYIVKGCVVEVQNLPMESLPGTHVLAALSLLPLSADADSLEHVVCGNIRSGGLTGKRGKTGKLLTLIAPQHHTNAIAVQTSTKWSPEHNQMFSLRNFHTLETADSAGNGTVGRGSPGNIKHGKGARILLTLMVGYGGDNTSSYAYARCVIPLASGENLDQWHPLETLKGEIITDSGNPASIRVRAAFLGASTNSEGSEFKFRGTIPSFADSTISKLRSRTRYTHTCLHQH